jgi:type I restriction enzyme R subunit
VHDPDLPFALEEVRKLAASKGKRFAVIADEAHSSQTNETAAKLKLVLSAAEMAELQDGGDVSAEDILAAQMAAKAGDTRTRASPTWRSPPRPRTRRCSCSARGLTPRAAGRRQHPGALPRLLDAPGHRGRLHPRRAEDLHPYKVAFSLAHHGKAIDSKEVDKSEAMKGIMGWVRLHEYNIAQRVQVVVEHFRKHVAGLLDGQAKAMVVTGSRKEAVRWQKATRKYIADHGYKIETLVAFSGEVIDPGERPDPFTEHSKD